jgi:transposase
MGRIRREFDEEFKREAVRLAESGTASITQVARDLGINAETLRNWRRKAKESSTGPESSGKPLSLEEENRRLKRENARLLEEREILKKATAFFARSTR